MDECSSSSDILSHIGCILTYGGNSTDIAINYSLVVMNSVWCCFVALTTADSVPNHNRRRLYHTSNVMALIFVVVFQVVLCLMVGCSGISIIWCAQAGWVVHQRYYSHRFLLANHESQAMVANVPKTELCVLGIDFLAILYYAVLTEPITTIAHFCALLLGALLSFLLNKGVQRVDGEENAPLVPT